MSQPGFVYRAFDDRGDLIYVGCTITPGSRFAFHQGQAAWWQDVATITLEKCPSREAALDREGEVILAERPRLNIRGAGGERARTRRERVRRADEWGYNPMDRRRA